MYSYSFSIFSVICYYCSLSIKFHNSKLDQIFSLERVKPLILNKALYKYNAIHNIISELNKFWKKYYLASIFTIIPINLICLHQAFYSKLDKSVMAIFLVVTFDTSFFIFFVNFISASIPFEIRKPFKKLSILQWKITIEAINSKIKVCKSYLHSFFEKFFIPHIFKVIYFFLLTFQLMSLFENLKSPFSVGFTVGNIFSMTFVSFFKVSLSPTNE